MKNPLPFTVLIERRVVRALGHLLLATTALILVAFPARAQNSEGKIASDLQELITLQKTP